MSTIHIVRPRPSRPLSNFFMHLGLTILAEALRKEDHEVRLVDLAYLDEADYLESFAQEPPAAVMMSLMIDNFQAGVELAGRLKAASPDTLVVAGGAHPTTIGARALKVARAIDVVGLGDCIPEVLEVLRARRGRGARGEPRVVVPGERMAAFAPVPAAAYRLWNGGRYFPVYPVELARGCPHRCPFCSDPVLQPKLEYAAPDSVLTVLEDLCAEHGEVFVRFADSSFSSLGEPLERLLAGIVERGLPVHWSAYAYTTDITPGLARTLRRSGCEALFLGVESLSPSVITGKRFQKDPARVGVAVGMLQEQGIHVHCNLIAGLPGETEETLRHTVEALAEIAPDSIGGGPFYLTPDTTFHSRLRQFEIEILDEDWMEKLHLSYDDPTYEYFKVRGVRQQQMRAWAAEMRKLSEERGLRWNLSDYPYLCWRSAGGTREAIYAAWDEAAGGAARPIDVDVLKEKRGVDLSIEQARGFVPALAGLAS